jgi:hypothetical protein
VRRSDFDELVERDRTESSRVADRSQAQAFWEGELSQRRCWTRQKAARAWHVLACRQGVAASGIVGSAAMTTIEQLVQSIDAHLETLHGEIEALTQARQELVANGAAPIRAAPARPRRGATRGGRRRQSRPSAEVAPAGKLHRLLLLAASDGLSTAALAEQANADPAQVLPLLHEMDAAGRVRRTGARRGTRWHAVAGEEEWIAQRAAELAPRSRR